MDSSWTQVELQSRRRWGSAEKSVEGDEKVGGGQRRQLQNLPRHRRFHRNRPTCFAKIGAILVGRHRRCRRFNEVLQLPQRKSRWGETKKSGRQTKKSSGRSVAGGWTGEIGLVENRSQACGDSLPGLWRFPFGLWFGAHGAVPELNLN